MQITDSSSGCGYVNEAFCLAQTFRYSLFVVSECKVSDSHMFHENLENCREGEVPQWCCDDYCLCLLEGFCISKVTTLPPKGR